MMVAGTRPAQSWQAYGKLEGSNEAKRRHHDSYVDPKAQEGSIDSTSLVPTLQAVTTSTSVALKILKKKII